MKTLIQSSYAMERAGIVGLVSKVWPEGQILDAEDLASLQEIDGWDRDVDLVVLDWRNEAAAEEVMQHFLGAGNDCAMDVRKAVPGDQLNGTSFKSRPAVIVFCHRPDVVQTRRIVGLGAKAVVPLTDPPAIVAALLSFVMAGGTYLPLSVLTQMPGNAAAKGGREAEGGTVISADDPRFKMLTRRQREVLRLINRGLSNEEIAEEIGVTLNTVKSHVSSMLKALGVKRRTQAMRMLTVPEDRTGL
ncbi:LuxR C-terminal-related transcriptional regulator [Hwanghaeella sp.]|uniref:response regulator transcription factor n=1 Tax=Hwanghaeella sp. TaxID=2605943 RepID=UPI003CCBE656